MIVVVDGCGCRCCSGGIDVSVSYATCAYSSALMAVDIVVIAARSVGKAYCAQASRASRSAELDDACGDATGLSEYLHTV